MGRDREAVVHEVGAPIAERRKQTFRERNPTGRTRPLNNHSVMLAVSPLLRRKRH